MAVLFICVSHYRVCECKVTLKRFKERQTVHFARFRDHLTLGFDDGMSSKIVFQQYCTPKWVTQTSSRKN